MMFRKDSKFEKAKMKMVLSRKRTHRQVKVDIFKFVLSFGLLTAGLFNLLHPHPPTPAPSVRSRSRSATMRSNANKYNYDSTSAFRVILSPAPVSTDVDMDMNTHKAHHSSSIFTSTRSSLGDEIIRSAGAKVSNGRGLSIMPLMSSQEHDFLSVAGHLCVDELVPLYDYVSSSSSSTTFASTSNPIIEMHRRLESLIPKGVDGAHATPVDIDTDANITRKEANVVRAIQHDLWKFCALGSGYASAYINPEQAFVSSKFRNGYGVQEFFQRYADRNYVVVFGFGSESDNDGDSDGDKMDVDQDDMDINRDERGEESRERRGRIQWVNSSVLILGTTGSGRRVAKAMVRSLLHKANDVVETLSSLEHGDVNTKNENQNANDAQRYNHVMWRAMELSRLIQEEMNTGSSKSNQSSNRQDDQWVLAKMKCSGLHVIPTPPALEKKLESSPIAFGDHVGFCARDAEVPCCEVLDAFAVPHTPPYEYAYSKSNEETGKIDLLLRHAIEGIDDYEFDTKGMNAMPDGGNSKDSITAYAIGPEPFHLLQMSSSLVDPYISSIVEVPSKTSISSSVPSARRMFDIMAENDCLPSLDCHRCIVKQNAQDFKSQCSTCERDCGCYCKMLCRIQPRPKKIAKECHVHIPSIKSKKNAMRLIPKRIHQTYFEEVTMEKYPNFSRLVSSWKLSGTEWEYNFYDNAASEEFLSRHFPPEVREAYDALIPGAYKADLFRYCILLIHGGIYADVDVLLSTDLDKLLENDVGFVVPVDEPGRPEGSGCCLWNGLLAVSPGHPFIAKAIEMVVNVIRNRYTAVDLDDMLCPSPNLEHSHSWDLLFVTGPCILGGAVNSVLGRHIQSEIAPGEMDVWNMQFANEYVRNRIASSIPGRTIILGQNKTDMGSHRFNWIERNFIVATTDMPDYDDRKDAKHYSQSTRENKRVLFGLKNVYKDLTPANEMIKIVVKQ